MDNKIKFILPVGIGDCKITNEVKKEDVIEVLKAFNYGSNKVIKKIALLLFVSCFFFQQNLTNEDVADKKR